MSGRLHLRIVGGTALAMMFFAGDSILCRMALRHTSIDAASFTAVRIISGAVTLFFIVFFRSGWRAPAGSWGSAAALMVYATGFSFAYVGLPASTGALLLFGAVQVTMIGRGWWAGERLHGRQWGGLFLALIGLVMLFLPGIAAPSTTGALLLLCAGAAWGIYSLRGRGSDAPVAETAGNFLRAVPMAFVLWIIFSGSVSIDPKGLAYAAASGAVTSGIGYAVWYSLLPALGATRAAAVQLSVPVLTAAAGILLLGEPITMHLALSSTAILGGITLVIVRTKQD